MMLSLNVILGVVLIAIDCLNQNLELKIMYIEQYGMLLEMIQASMEK